MKRKQMNQFLQAHRKYFLVVMGMFLADLTTKMLACWLLPYNKEVRIAGEKLYLYLTYNFGAMGGQAEYILGEVNKANTKLVFSALAAITIGTYLLLIQKATLKLAWKIVIGLAIYLLLVLCIETMYETIQLPFPDHFTSWFTKVGATFLYSSIFYVLQNKVLKVLIAVILGCGLGNLINHFYPPYHVVDFIYSDFLYRWWKMGIFNLADLVLNITEIMIVFYLLYLLGKRIGLVFIKPTARHSL